MFSTYNAIMKKSIYVFSVQLSCLPAQVQLPKAQQTPEAWPAAIREIFTTRMSIINLLLCILPWGDIAMAEREFQCALLLGTTDLSIPQKAPLVQSILLGRVYAL